MPYKSMYVSSVVFWRVFGIIICWDL